MNILKTLVITATLINFCNHLSAQKKDKEATIEKKWYIKVAFPVSDTQSLAIFEHKYTKSGVVLVNNMGAIQWELPYKGCVMAISKYKDHYLVFYTTKGYWDKSWGSTVIMKQINAATIDIKSKQVIEDKVIYTGNTYVVPDFQNDPAGNFSQLLLRQSIINHQEQTKGFTIISFNADGSVASKEIGNSMANGGSFAGSSAGKDGSIFISSIQNLSSVVVEKFSHEGTFISKLESPLPIHKDAEYIPLMRTDPTTNNSVILTFRALNTEKDYAFSYFGFNFDNNQVGVVNEAPLSKKSSPYQIEGFRSLLPIDILFTNDKVIVVREVRYNSSLGYGSSSRTTYNSRNAVVSVFDKQMKQKREIIINKATSSYSHIDIGISCHINNDKLLIVSGENTSMGKYDNFCYKVNLNEGSYERKKIGINRSSSTTSISTISTIWLNNEFIMTNLHIGSFGTGGPGVYSSRLERVGYETL